MKKEEEKTAKVVQMIAALRAKKGLSLENIAFDLEITPAAYRKIEKRETNLTVERLFKIAEILGEKVSKLLDSDENTFNQTNNDSATGNQYQQTIENFYQENKEVYERLIASKDEQIKLLNRLIEMKFSFLDALPV